MYELSVNDAALAAGGDIVSDVIALQWVWDQAWSVGTAICTVVDCSVIPDYMAEVTDALAAAE